MRISYLYEFVDQLERLDSQVQRRLKEKLKELHRIPGSTSYVHQPLKGPQFKGLYKLKVGDWRLIYRLVNGELQFITLGHRSEVYK